MRETGRDPYRGGGGGNPPGGRGRRGAGAEGRGSRREGRSGTRKGKGAKNKCPSLHGLWCRNSTSFFRFLSCTVAVGAAKRATLSVYLAKRLVAPFPKKQTSNELLECKLTNTLNLKNHLRCEIMFFCLKESLPNICRSFCLLCCFLRPRILI